MSQITKHPGFVTQVRRAGGVVRALAADRQQRTNDQGSTLLLALGFLLITSITVFSVATWSGNSLLDSLKFQSQSSLDYALGAAVQTEIQNLRYAYQPTTSTAYGCTPGSGQSVSLNGQAVSVFCTVVETPLSAATRVITLSACSYSSVLTAATCAASPLLKAVVTFDDFSSNGVLGCISASAEVSCGTAMAITSWTLAR